MRLLSKLFYSVLSFCSLVFTLSSLITFYKFLSDFPSKISLATTAPQSDADAAVPNAVEAVAVDLSLLCVFIILHSSLIPLHKVISSVLGMPFLNKVFYSVISALSLQLIVRWWMPIPEFTFWNVDTQDVDKLRFFTGVHIVSWILIYAMMITIGLPDLLGLKQVYCHMTGRSEESTLNSERMKHFHQKMRHPSFLGFALIFWVYPCMRLDRLLLATVWTLYMLLAWRPDTYTFNYLVQQNMAKRSAL
ncbi:nurim homolog [Macrosteles quadrilineatus]|uniref:nurim homolog n=1 Tax=Macrosteles quadrilineatus TaxID=74068 RepID=UPI0023E1D543|nr:nurim homolog [Macrosteles quadrilineatus]